MSFLGGISMSPLWHFLLMQGELCMLVSLFDINTNKHFHSVSHRDHTILQEYLANCLPFQAGEWTDSVDLSELNCGVWNQEFLWLFSRIRLSLLSGKAHVRELFCNFFYYLSKHSFEWNDWVLNWNKCWMEMTMILIFNTWVIQHSTIFIYILLSYFTPL